jgi:thiamine pyrophosphate-dependent acetolactate synthase large subunit-like protein
MNKLPFFQQMIRKILNRVGNLSVQVVTSGPGANIVTGIMHAWFDSILLIIFGGQSKSYETIAQTKHKKIRQVGFEANSVEILKPITKFSYLFQNPEDIKFYFG